MLCLQTLNKEFNLKCEHTALYSNIVNFIGKSKNVKMQIIVNKIGQNGLQIVGHVDKTVI